MKFWDSSCLVSLLVEEPSSAGCRALMRADPKLSGWTFAPLEILVALARKRREGVLGDGEFALARSRLSRLAGRWVPFQDSADLRTHAERVAGIYELRTGDVLQLAAALVWCDGRARGRQFVAGDERLIAAASGEGFTTIHPA